MVNARRVWSAVALGAVLVCLGMLVAPAHALIKNRTEVPSFDFNTLTEEYEITATLRRVQIKEWCELSWPAEGDAAADVALLVDMLAVHKCGCHRLSQMVDQIHAVVQPAALIAVSLSVENPGYQDEPNFGLYLMGHRDSVYTKMAQAGVRLVMLSAADRDLALAIPEGETLVISSTPSVKTVWLTSAEFAAWRWFLLAAFLALTLGGLVQIGLLVYVRHTRGTDFNMRFWIFLTLTGFSMMRVIEYAVGDPTWGPHTTWNYAASYAVFWLGFVLGYLTVVLLLTNWAKIAEAQVGVSVHVRRGARVARVVSAVGLCTMVLMMIGFPVSHMFPYSTTSEYVIIALNAILAPTLFLIAFLHLFLGAVILHSLRRFADLRANRTALLRLTYITMALVLGFLAFVIEATAYAIIADTDISPRVGALLDIVNDLTAIAIIVVSFWSLSVRGVYGASSKNTAGVSSSSGQHNMSAVAPSKIIESAVEELA